MKSLKHYIEPAFDIVLYPILFSFCYHLASQEVDMRVRVLSKAFMTALRIHDRATLIGPPETPKDHVIAAAKAMRMGNWRNCLNFIINPKMEAKVSCYDSIR